jgi:rhomboid family GlyGly-CTERM serine protease
MRANPTSLQNASAAGDGFIGRFGLVIALTAGLLAVNWPLLVGGINTDLIFFPQAVVQGQWWRVLTYPLVHLSWYHFLLDGGAFLLLFHSLEDQKLRHRLAYVAGAGICSLCLALVLEPSIAQRGLCGLSGIAHGLMAVTGLEMMAADRYRFPGLLTLLAVVIKSAWELWTGQVFFADMHFGDYGTPLLACHGGGVLGALLVYGVCREGANGESNQNQRRR